MYEYLVDNEDLDQLSNEENESFDHSDSFNEPRRTSFGLSEESMQQYHLSVDFPAVFGPGLLLRNTVTWLSEVQQIHENKYDICNENARPSVKPLTERRRNKPRTKFDCPDYSVPPNADSALGRKWSEMAKGSLNMGSETYEQFSRTISKHYDHVQKLKKSFDETGDRITFRDGNDFRNNSKHLLNAMAYDTYHISGSIKYMSNFAENLVDSRRSKSTKLRRETNSTRAKAARAMQASHEVKKTLKLMSQHLENIYHKLKIDLGELDPLLRSKLEDFDQAFSADMEQTSELLRALRTLMLKEYSVLFLDDSKSYRLSDTMTLLFRKVILRVRGTLHWCAGIFTWMPARNRSFVGRFIDRNREYFYMFYLCIINYAIWKIGRESLPYLVSLYMDAMEYVLFFQWTEELPNLYRQIFLFMWRLSDTYGLMNAARFIQSATTDFVIAYFFTIPDFWFKKLFLACRPLCLWVPESLLTTRIYSLCDSLKVFRSQVWEIFTEEFRENIIKDFVEANATMAISQWLTEYETAKNKPKKILNSP